MAASLGCGRGAAGSDDQLLSRVHSSRGCAAAAARAKSVTAGIAGPTGKARNWR